MASTSQNVLVFGPTGGVGCATAIEARRRGASVWLAMRDIEKSISGLDSSESGYHRVQADLTDPSSLTQAVEKSSAKVAFVYVVHTSADHMASSFAALKAAGITYIVMLSSYTVQGPANSEVNMDGFISKIHAVTEVALEESGIPYAAVRPMYFNTNVFWNQQDIKNGKADLLYPEVKFDYLSPSDIGAVCGAVLAEPRFQQPDEGSNSKTILLCGPELLTQRRAHEIIGEKVGRELNINELSEDEWYEKSKWMPRPALDALTKGLRKSHEGHNVYPKERYEEAAANIKKYKEAKPMMFGEWVEANKAEFM